MVDNTIVTNEASQKKASSITNGSLTERKGRPGRKLVEADVRVNEKNWNVYLDQDFAC